MKNFIFGIVTLVVCANAFAQTADTAPSSPNVEIESLRRQVQALTEMVKALQQQVNAQQQATPPQLNPEPNPLPQNPEPVAIVAAASTPVAAPKFATQDSSVVASAPAEIGITANGTATGPAFATSDASVTTATDSTTSGLAAPITIASGGGGKNYMNISFDSVFTLADSSDRNLSHLEVGDHDPQQRGFNARNSEIALDGAVDPYFEGFANIVLKLDNDNETSIELEEAFLQTTSLPFGLQVKAGQFFDQFGRLNATHPHTWDFADSPLVNGRLLGSDGLRGVGAQLSWTLPLPFYSQLIFATQNGRGNTGYSFRNPGDNGIFYDRLTNDRELRGLGDLLYVPRLEASFNPSATQTVLLGTSAAFGPNDTGDHTRTQIYGGDFLYKWKSPRAEGGFPFVKWQTEVMYRNFEAGRGVDDTFPIAETFHDWGMYSQVLWGFKKGWVAGLRGDYLHMSDSIFTSDPDRQTRSRISADLTWYPTEFSKLRLQYNHDFLDENEFLPGREADSVFLQFEFILGAHGAHKF